MIHKKTTVGNEVVEWCKNFPEIREPLQNSRNYKGDKKQHSEGSQLLCATVLRLSSEQPGALDLCTPEEL